MANHILLVTQLDLPCLRNVVRLMMSFGQMEAIKNKIKIIVNRVGLDNQIGLKKAQETIGRDIFWQLPNDYRVMVEVRNNGVPLIEQAPKAAITQSIIGLAQALCGSGEVGDDAAAAGSKTATMTKLLNLWPGRTRPRPSRGVPGGAALSVSSRRSVQLSRRADGLGSATGFSRRPLGLEAARPASSMQAAAGWADRFLVG